MVNTPHLRDLDMRVNGMMVSGMDLVHISSLVVIDSKANGKTVMYMELANIYGQMVKCPFLNSIVQQYRKMSVSGKVGR
jgi:hypothetical protein